MGQVDKSEIRMCVFNIFIEQTNVLFFLNFI